MPDYTILDFQQVLFGQLWSSLQWWASVSFGLMALTRFSGKQLNLVIVLSISVLYTLFTVFTLTNILMLVDGLVGAGDDLQALRDAGALGGAGSELLDFRRQHAPLNGAIAIFCVIATFVATLSYLVYTYRKERRSARPSVSS
jgi:hypothetical protein